MKQKIFGTAAMVSVIATFAACSSNKSDSSSSAATCPSAATGTAGGYVLCLGSATTATFSLDGGSSQQYVVAPYSLGDLATVTGGGDTKLSGFKVAATSASLNQLRADHAALSEAENADGEAMRMVVNQFDRRLGLNQPEWLWSTLRQFDLADRAKANLTSHRKSNMLNKYQDMAKTGFDDADPALPLTTLAGCPTSIPKVDNSATTFTASTSYDGTSFCVVYASDPISETKTNIQNSISTILTAYKSSIYNDQFTANTANGYSFNPVIVIVDPTSSTMWPQGASYKFAGAFSKDATTAAKRPIIYLMDDLTSVGVSVSKVTATVHATLAHEMQHAIMDYYRTRGTATNSETVAIDEGIAHTFEDAFGYGANNFSDYVSAFLSSVPDGAPAMVTGSGYNANKARGGANSFMYFLAQRAGGFTVTSNRPFSGGGMTFLVNLVKQTSATGPTALQSTFGSQNLTEQVGQFFGAIFTDNKSLSFAPTIFTSAQYDNVADLQGNTNKTFGIRFNNFNSFTSAGTNSLADGSKGLDAANYGSVPVLVTPSAATSTVTVTFPASTSNNGVAVVRVK